MRDHATNDTMVTNFSLSDDREREPTMVQEAQRALTGEAFAIGELARLMADPVNYGLGVPRGDGRYVVVLPGLFASDFYLTPIRSWLSRIGYRPVESTLRSNVGCPERLSRQVEAALQSKLDRRDRPAALIGHSRGGLLARATAARLQERCSHLILLGSPVGALSWMRVGVGPRRARFAAEAPASEFVMEASAQARRRADPGCDFPNCGCPFPKDVRRALHPDTRVVSIFSRNDPIVPASACRMPDAECIEVGGTHSGLAFNTQVYREIARALAD